MSTEGLLDDSRFAESYIRYRTQRGFGPKRVSLELRERGVADGIIAVALETMDGDWSSILEKTWQKKFGRPPRDFKEKVKHHRFLEYRGFHRDSIAQYLSCLEDSH